MMILFGKLPHPALPDLLEASSWTWGDVDTLRGAAGPKTSRKPLMVQVYPAEGRRHPASSLLAPLHPSLPRASREQGSPPLPGMTAHALGALVPPGDGSDGHFTLTLVLGTASPPAGAVTPTLFPILYGMSSPTLFYLVSKTTWKNNLFLCTLFGRSN